MNGSTGLMHQDRAPLTKVTGRQWQLYFSSASCALIAQLSKD
jgi:hypothetical protein